MFLHERGADWSGADLCEAESLRPGDGVSVVGFLQRGPSVLGPKEYRDGVQSGELMVDAAPGRDLIVGTPASLRGGYDEESSGWKSCDGRREHSLSWPVSLCVGLYRIRHPAVRLEGPVAETDGPRYAGEGEPRRTWGGQLNSGGRRRSSLPLSAPPVCAMLVCLN